MKLIPNEVLKTHLQRLEMAESVTFTNEFARDLLMQAMEAAPAVVQVPQPDFPLSAWGTMGYTKSALSAMLTHMGMDEDEWNRPTFEQARSAVRALEYQLARPDQVSLWKARYESVKGPLSRFHQQAVAKGYDGIVDAIAAAPEAPAQAAPPSQPEAARSIFATPPSSVQPASEWSVAYVCPDKDIVCGNKPVNWCKSCPLRAMYRDRMPGAEAHPLTATPVVDQKAADVSLNASVQQKGDGIDETDFIARITANVEARNASVRPEKDERATFEAWARQDRGGNTAPHPQNPSRYASATVQGWWQAWRAALVHPAVERVPLSEERADDIVSSESWGPDAITYNASLLRVIRKTERAHGIGTEGGEHG